MCTNKLEWLSKRLLDQLGLSARFAAICGADTFGVSKPDPVILQQTVARAGGDMAATIMVGDAGPDVGVARRAGIPVIGVEFGYTDVPIAELKPDRLIGHMRDLPAAVESLSKAASDPNHLIYLIYYGTLVFSVNHSLTILPGSVAALFSHSYGSPWGLWRIAASQSDRSCVVSSRLPSPERASPGARRFRLIPSSRRRRW